jgi:DNA-binding CsgD family transcriptional regulator
LGVLAAAEMDRLRAHSYMSERILAASAVLRPLIDLIGVHERLDGSGYHRRIKALSQSPAARLLAVCDVYVALGQARPHRPAHLRNAIIAILGEEARAGRLDREAVRVVLDAEGQRQPRLRGDLPAGLTPREVEVLVLVARGRSNKQIGVGLHVAERTVKSHVARIYDKLGVRTRAGAALFAVQHALLERGPSEN